MFKVEVVKENEKYTLYTRSRKGLLKKLNKKGVWVLANVENTNYLNIVDTALAKNKYELRTKIEELSNQYKILNRDLKLGLEHELLKNYSYAEKQNLLTLLIQELENASKNPNRPVNSTEYAQGLVRNIRSKRLF